MCIWLSSANLREKVKFPHNTENGFQIDGFAVLPLNPASDAAASIGLLASLLAINNEIDEPLIFRFFSLPVTPCVVAAAGNLEQSAHVFDRIFLFKPFDDTIFQLHLLPTSDRKFRSNSTCIRNVANSLFRFCSSLSDSLRGPSFWPGYISICHQSLFAVLALDQSFDLCFAQSKMCANLTIGFSRCFPPKYFFAEHFYFRIFSGHDDTSCCSFYSTTGGAFFLCPFFRVWSKRFRGFLVSYWLME